MSFVEVLHFTTPSPIDAALLAMLQKTSEARILELLSPHAPKRVEQPRIGNEMHDEYLIILVTNLPAKDFGGKLLVGCQPATSAMTKITILLIEELLRYPFPTSPFISG
jgi:hypothetical protein